MAAPSTSLLDDFTRPDENPIVGPIQNGSWTAKIDAGDGAMQVVSNKMQGVNVSANNSRYWSRSFGVDQEVYCTCQTDTGLFLSARLTNPNSSAWNCYQLECIVSSNTMNLRQMIAASNNFTVFSSTMAALGLPTMVSGDRYALQVKRGGPGVVQLQIWADFGNTGVWTKVLSQQDGPPSDLTYGGFVGITLFDNSTTRTVANVGGGTLPSPRMESLGRRPVPMIKGPDRDRLMAMQVP